MSKQENIALVNFERLERDFNITFGGDLADDDYKKSLDEVLEHIIKTVYDSSIGDDYTIEHDRQVVAYIYRDSAFGLMVYIHNSTLVYQVGVLDAKGDLKHRIVTYFEPTTMELNDKELIHQLILDISSILRKGMNFYNVADDSVRDDLLRPRKYVEVEQ